MFLPCNLKWFIIFSIDFEQSKKKCLIDNLITNLAVKGLIFKELGSSNTFLSIAL